MAYDFGNWFTDAVKDLVPAHTIVGKAVRGDTSGAAQSAVKLAQGSMKAKAKPMPTAGMQEPGVFAPGGFVDQNKTMLLVIAAGLGAFLLMGKGRR